MLAALFLLVALPVLAEPITGSAMSNYAAGHGFWIDGPGFYLYSGWPDGPPLFAVCPTGGACEVRGLVPGYLDRRRWGAHYKGHEVGVVDGFLEFTGPSITVPTGAADEWLSFDGLPVTFSGRIKGWAPAGPDEPEADPGPLVLELAVSGSGVMSVTGRIDGGLYYIPYATMTGLTGEATVLYEAVAPIPEPGTLSLLAAGLALIAPRRRQTAWRARPMLVAILLLAVARPALPASIKYSSLGVGFEFPEGASVIAIGSGVPFAEVPTHISVPVNDFSSPPFFSGEFDIVYGAGDAVTVTGTVYEYEPVEGPAFVAGPVVATHTVGGSGTVFVQAAGQGGYWGVWVTLDEQQHVLPIPEPNGLALLGASLAGVALLGLTVRQSAGVARVRAPQRPAGVQRRRNYAVG